MWIRVCVCHIHKKSHDLKFCIRNTILYYLRLFGSYSPLCFFTGLFIIFITLCAYGQSSPLPRSDQHQKATNLSVAEDATFNSTTHNPLNSTIQPLDVENTTIVHEDGNAVNLTTDPWKDLETTETDDDVNWSQEPTDGMKHSDAECVSQRTRNYLASPCGVRERPRRSVCNINNIFHVKQGAKMLLQTLVRLSIFFSLEIEAKLKCISYIMKLFLNYS